ncbi:MAG TPA: helix-turn-helix transcriptional regulator [Actinomycetota bacterium]|nr:helix-turn-helix transcriptional regulator [Actinomycetota bacterium]
MGRAAGLIIEARRRAGISQAELARRAGLPRSVLNAYEHANREPGADTLIRILAAAGFDVHLQPRIDVERNARILEQVLELAEGLPYRPRKTLAYPRFKRQAG